MLPSAGLTYQFGEGYSVYASYSKGLQVPGTDQLYNAFFSRPMASRAASSDAGSAASALIPTARPPAALISATASAYDSARRASSTTGYALEKRTAVARPVRHALGVSGRTTGEKRGSVGCFTRGGEVVMM